MCQPKSNFKGGRSRHSRRCRYGDGKAWNSSLDIVCRIKEKFDFPVAVQNVSGEYAMVKAAAIHGWIKEEEWKINSIASIKRAGADKIISYFTLDLCEQLSD